MCVWHRIQVLGFMGKLEEKTLGPRVHYVNLV